MEEESIQAELVWTANINLSICYDLLGDYANSAEILK